MDAGWGNTWGVIVEELDIEGLFWRPEAPENKIAGRLRFNRSDGAILSLIDSADNPSYSEHSFRLLGAAGSQRLTLEQCQVSGETTHSNGVIQRRFRVSVVLSGAHFDDPVRFDSFTVRLGNLVQWVGASGLSVESISKDDSKDVSMFQITYTPIASTDVPTSDGTLVLTFPWSYRIDRLGESAVEHDCAFKYRLKKPEPLASILSTCSSLRHLLTICTHSPSFIIATELTHPDCVLPQMKSQSLPINVYSQWIGTERSTTNERIHPSTILFTFDDLGGLDGIRRWLEIADKYASLISTLVSHWYVPKLFQEHRYFNAVVAAETLVRIRKNEQNVRLKVELLGLCHEMRNLFEPLVGNLNKWVAEVVQTRTNMVMHPGLRGSSNGYRLYLLSESIYILVVLSLFRECGVSDDTLTSIQNNQHFMWLSERLSTRR